MAKHLKMLLIAKWVAGMLRKQTLARSRHVIDSVREQLTKCLSSHESYQKKFKMYK